MGSDKKEREFLFKALDPDLKHVTIRIAVDVMGSEVYDAKILGITDGDTLRVRISSLGIPDKVRLLGIDSPETGTGEHATRQCDRLEVDMEVLHTLAKISTIHLQWLCPKGTKVSLRTTERARDENGRILAGLFEGDLCINRMMVESGYAMAYQGVSDWESYQDLELKAKEAGKGIWGMCEEDYYLGSTKTYHRPGCPSARYATSRFTSPSEAKRSGLSPCSLCLPDFRRSA